MVVKTPLVIAKIQNFLKRRNAQEFNQIENYSEGTFFFNFINQFVITFFTYDISQQLRKHRQL